jgi:carboxyl-terminal processing protease
VVVAAFITNVGRTAVSFADGRTVGSSVSWHVAPADGPLPDFGSLSFTAAFDSLCVHYSKYYAFTDWKSIDWTDLHERYSPAIQFAETNSDTNGFRLAMKQFVSEFPDGHVRLRGDFREIYGLEIGGGFGLTLVELSDGGIAVNRVLDGGPAAAAGIEIGAIIDSWDGQPVESALIGSDIVWEGNPPATSEGVRLAQLRRLVRAPVGTTVGLSCTNPGQTPATIALTAVDDSLRSWELSRFTVFDTNGSPALTPEQFLDPVTYEVLPDGIGYLRSSILVEFDEYGNITGNYAGIVDSIRSAVDTFNARAVKGVVVDIRDNPGGYDQLAAIFGGFFYDHTEVYEHASFYDTTANQFEILPLFTLHLEPQSSHFSGPVVCLVNAGTASSAEGVAMAIQRVPLGNVMGIYATHGSFGLVSGETPLPAGLGVQFTLGRSLDENFDIQIDSDHAMAGGVAPDIRIPLTVPIVQSKFGSGVDVELDRAISYLVSLTPVRLSNFEVARRNSNAILTWEVSGPYRDATFHIWREEHARPRARVSTRPIAGDGVLQFADPDAPRGETTYWLQEIDADGNASWLGSVTLPAIDTTPGRPALFPNRPNPFNTHTKISFFVNYPYRVRIDIHDAAGRRVATLTDDRYPAGDHYVFWDGRDAAGKAVASGIYFLRFTANKKSETRKLVLVR